MTLYSEAIENETEGNFGKEWKIFVLLFELLMRPESPGTPQKRYIHSVQHIHTAHCYDITQAQTSNKVIHQKQ